MKFKDLVAKDSKKFKVWLDISTFCNAACPQCHRTDPNGLGKVGWLPLIKWSLEDFKRKFPPGSIDAVTVFELCGTWGDPVMSKDLGKICEYIIDNSTAEIHINTNGGLRTPKWWEDLGNYCGNRLTVYFDIDGKTNEMHQKYRRGVDLQTVLDNMEALSNTEATPRAFIIMFKHNQDHIFDIKNLVRMYGAKDIHVIKSDRFLTHSRWDFVDENGNPDYLEEVDGDVDHLIKNSWINTAEKNMLTKSGRKEKRVNSKMLGRNDR